MIVLWCAVDLPVGGTTQMTLLLLKLIHTATPNTTKLSCLCRVRFGGVNWIPDKWRLSPTKNLKSEHVQSYGSIYIGTLDTTQTGPSCRVWRVMWIRHYCHCHSNRRSARNNIPLLTKLEQANTVEQLEKCAVLSTCRHTPVVCLLITYLTLTLTVWPQGQCMPRARHGLYL